MPYIIETSTPRYHSAFGREVPHLTHTAVATLDEAAAVVVEARNRANERRPGATTSIALDESGGTVGPLPDGTVIEVKRA